MAKNENIDVTEVVEEPKEAKKPTKKAEEPKTTNLYDQETYEVTLQFDENHQDDVLVMINGESYQIQRGVPVTVPAAVFEVLENSRKMDLLATRRAASIAKDFN